MNRSPLALLAISFLTTSTSATAGEPTLEQIITACKAKYTVLAAVSQCVTDIRFAQSERRDDAIVAELERGAERDEEILGRLDQTDGRLASMEVSINRIEAAQTAPVATVVAPTAETAPVQTVAVSPQTTGLGWQPVVQATTVSIHNITALEPDTLHVTHVRDQNSRKRCGGMGSDLLLVTNHGYPVGNTHEPPGMPSGFLLVYYDANGDGEPEQSVWALDLSTQDDFWVTWRQGDDLRFVYLRRSGKIVVEGMGVQTVYRPPTKADSNVVACRQDVLDRPGDHQVAWAYNLARD